MKRLKQIDAYVEKNSVWSDTLILLREAVASTVLKESVKWGGPVYTLEGKNVVGLGAFKNFAALWFFQGALLSDPLGVLVNAQEGKTKALRQWRFGPSDTVPVDQVIQYLQEAISNQRQGLMVRLAKPTKKPLLIPQELEQMLSKDLALQHKFEALGLTIKRELTDFISTAKRSETKLRRLEKVRSLIELGKGPYQK